MDLFGSLGKALQNFGSVEGGQKSSTDSSNQNPAKDLGAGLKSLMTPATATAAAPVAGAEGGAASAIPMAGGADLAASAGPALLLADADLKEPDGDAHWTLREEKDFILAKNQRTGEVRKLLTAPLSKKEKEEAEAKHGAGPLDAKSPARQHTTMSDMSLKGSYGDLDLAAAEATHDPPMQSVSMPSTSDSSYSSVEDIVKRMVSQHVNDMGQRVVEALDNKFKKKSKK